MKKIGKILLSILLIFIIICVVGVKFMFNKNDYKKGDSSSLKAIDKVRKAEKSGGTVSLSSEELNNIFSIIYKNKKQIGNITINTPQAFLEKDYGGVKIPVVYKNKEFILSSKGKVSVESGNVIYKPDYFKIGKMKVSKKLVLDKLNNFKGKGISLSEDNIKIDKKAIPFSIKDLSIKDSVLTISMDKLPKNTLFNKDHSDKIESSNKGEKDKNINNSTGNTNSNKNSQNQDNQARINALSNIGGQLANASASAGSAKGQQIIGIMISTVNKMMSNPNYNYSQDAASAKSIYSTLSAKEKEALKKALYSNVDTSNVNQLKNTFGI
ncbi:hypothetical protein AAGC94_12950 [Clostridium sporogenes]|uniref:hypothetical protein n=1 Tax=Clostridium sporogenes TaxID=1509 RepID=UPI00313AB198